MAFARVRLAKQSNGTNRAAPRPAKAGGLAVHVRREHGGCRSDGMHKPGLRKKSMSWGQKHPRETRCNATA